MPPPDRRPRSLPQALAIAVCGFLASAIGWAAPPTGIDLSSHSVPEGLPPDSLVATISAIDADAGDTHYFSLVPGPGDTNNGGFLILGNQLYLIYGVEHDFESGPYQVSIRLRVVDSTSQIHEQVHLIQVVDDRDEDADRDGLTEAQEEDLHGTSDVIFDGDGDGVGDGAEVAAGSSPLHATQWPSTAIVSWGSSEDGTRSVPAGSGFIGISSAQNHNLALRSDGSVLAWGGANSFGQSQVPSGLGPVSAVAAGGDGWLADSSMSVALKQDGSLATWGFNDDGKIVVPPGLDNVVAISAGRSHGLALQADGTVTEWGYNPFLGKPMPVGLDDGIAISAGGYHSMALRYDGSVHVWGSLFDGEQWVPASSPVGLTDVVAISAGRFHCLALREDGTVVAWGFGSHGQTMVPSGLQDVVAIAAGGFHSLALKQDGSVVAWGMNDRGQCSVPPAASTGVRRISAGIFHSLAVLQDVGYPAITSGSRVSGAPGLPLSHAVTVAHAQPTLYQAVGLPQGLAIDPQTGVISGVPVGPHRTAARIEVKTDQGTLTQTLWFRIYEGSSPVSVSIDPAFVTENLIADSAVGQLTVVDPDLGDVHSFELIDGPGAEDNGRFRIFGSHLILNQTMDRDFEADSSGFSIRVRARDASLNPVEAVIALQFVDDRNEDLDGDGLSEAAEEDLYQTSDLLYDTDGDGFGDRFEVERGWNPDDSSSVPNGRMLLNLGASDQGRSTQPSGVADLIDVSAGAAHSIAVTSAGDVLAWGANGSNQSQVPPGLAPVLSADAGDFHNLALHGDGSVSAWGANEAGQCTIPPSLTAVAEVSAGGAHSLALLTDGSLAAWGSDSNGQCQVPSGLGGSVAISAGGAHSVALRQDGTVAAWGSNAHGQSAVPSGLSRVVAVSAGAAHTLALKQDGTVVAWGSNLAGQCEVPDHLRGVISISAGAQHSVALRDDGSVVFWGLVQGMWIPECVQVRRISAGGGHSAAIRQMSGFPDFADVSTIRGWPGQLLSRSFAVVNASASSCSAMGLPPDLALDGPSGVLSGTVDPGGRGAMRIRVVTDQGSWQRVFGWNTLDGHPPTDLKLVTNAPLPEHSPDGTVAGVLSAVDPDAGDLHAFSIVPDAASPDGFRFRIQGNQVLVDGPLAADFDSGDGLLRVRVRAVDSGGNPYEKAFKIAMADDRSEDADGDGFNEATEEDLLGTGDLVADDFRTADPDGDGMPSLLEHAFNLDPKSAGPSVQLTAGGGDSAGLPAVTMASDGMGHRRLRIEFIRRIGTAMTYQPEFSSSPDSPVWTPAGAAMQTAPIDAVWERCTVEDTENTATHSRRFARVVVSW